MEAEKREDHHDDDDQTDEVNDSIHERSPAESGRFPGQLAQQFRRSEIHSEFDVLHCSLKCVLADLVSSCFSRQYDGRVQSAGGQLHRPAGATH